MGKGPQPARDRGPVLGKTSHLALCRPRSGRHNLRGNRSLSTLGLGFPVLLLRQDQDALPERYLVSIDVFFQRGPNEKP